jgi:hypothetical protein
LSHERQGLGGITERKERRREEERRKGRGKNGYMFGIPK